MHFKDRSEAGKKLAAALAKYKGEDAIVYALPRGGVILGAEISKALGAPLDLAITRKIGHPFEPEYAVCAVAEDGDLICNESEKASLDQEWFKKETEKEKREARRRREVYLKGRAPLETENKTAIIVDDGVATGLTIELAIREVKHLKPKKVVVALPVLPADAAEKIKKEADELVALDITLDYLGAVGAYYENFPQIEDAEVIKILETRNNKQIL